VRRLAAITLAFVAVAGCRRQPAGRPVDVRLLAALEEARAWQHRADVHLAERDVAGAIADVQGALAVRFPSGAPEGEEARLDAWARLAKLEVGPSPEAEARALDAVEHGRREATRDSFYRAHLETVAGEIHEARAARLEAGDAAGAREARRAALDDYARSIDIDKRVQDALLGEAP
jgi:hypothetical protein